MSNLEWLYKTDEAFALAVDNAAAESIGSTNPKFAHEWLTLKHKKEDE